MSDRERRRTASEKYAAGFIDPFPGCAEVAAICYAAEEAITNHYLAGAESEAAHWEQRVKGLRLALEQIAQGTGNSSWTDRTISKEALIEFRASADDAPEGK